ncbi:MAG: hypothetical protein AAF919_01080 [Pseudomonadota bacterium]
MRERIDLPKGHFALIRTDPFDMTPRFPGQSGDRPGQIAIFTPDGASCGVAPLAMVGHVTLDYTADGDEVTLGRPRQAAWTLSTCRVRYTDLYRDLER